MKKIILILDLGLSIISCKKENVIHNVYSCRIQQGDSIINIIYYQDSDEIEKNKLV